MALVSCTALPLKLHHFFEFAGQAIGGPFPIKDKAAIARHLNIPRARVTEWTQADDDKNRPVNSVQNAHVEELARLYALLAPGPILAEEAYRYWRYVLRIAVESVFCVEGSTGQSAALGLRVWLA